MRNKDDSNVVLKIDNLNHSGYSLKNINLEVYEGEFFALLGPSGCGKTTLLKTIAGFLQPDSGQILLDGNDITHIPPNKRPINMMFQSYALFPHMNVYDNIAFGMKQDNTPEYDIRNQIGMLLETLRISDLKYRSIQDLSGGQQQRIALARCLAKKPKVILLDEPLGALDLKTTEHTQIELLNIKNIFGITFIMVTHNQDEAMSMSNRMAIMNQGEILQVGAPEELYEYPSSIFVADFIGTMNMLDGVIIDKSGDCYKMIIGSLIEQVCTVSNKLLANGDKIIIGLRPEELYISQFPFDGENNLPATVIDVAFHGSFIVYHVKLANEQIITVRKPTSARVRKINIKPGDSVNVSWNYSDGVIL